MKIKAKEYAQAIIGSKQFNLQNFLHILDKNGDRKKLREIVAWIEKMEHRKVVVETARKTKTVWRFEKNDIVEEKINPDLIAGARLTINGEKQLDFSLKNKLEKIFT